MLMRRWITGPLLATLLALPLHPILAAEGDQEDPPAATARKEIAANRSAELDHNPGIYAPTIGGLTGLFRLVTSDIGRSHTFRIGLHTELFQSSDFLVTGDTNSRFIGTLAASYTPWRFLEFFFNIRSSANNNERTRDKNNKSELDDPLILALGDMSFGGKGQYPIHPAFSLGGNFAVSLLNSVGGTSFNGDATGFYVGLLSSFDLDPLASFPLRFHMNFGYQLDGSNNLATFNGYSLASLQVEKFALGMNPSRLQFKFGMDLPLRRWTKFGLTPIFELLLDTSTGEPDPDFENKTVRDVIKGMLASRMGVTPSKVTEDDINNEIDPRNTMWLTLGVRATPVKGFNVELASDIGVVSPGYGHGPPVVPWNLILGFSYAYDPAPPTKIITREKVRTVMKEADRPKGGKLRGRVINAKTMEPIEGAIVTFPGKDLTGLATDPDGTFLTYELPPGPHPVMVRHPDYEPGKLTAEIKVSAMGSQDVKLTPQPPKVGKVSGRVSDPKGSPIAATIAIAGAESRQVQADASGAFTLELKPGSYTLSVSANGYLRKEQLISLVGGAALTADFTLSLKPKISLVAVTKNEIRIKKQVHFATNAATILPDSSQLLDSIVDVLVANPQIKRVEIGGHTDNRGADAANQQLSQARADAVKEHLVRNGISPDRLDAKGYGASKPKGPNITPLNRARNRRVEFLITEQ